MVSQRHKALSGNTGNGLALSEVNTMSLRKNRTQGTVNTVETKQAPKAIAAPTAKRSHLADMQDEFRTMIEENLHSQYQSVATYIVRSAWLAAGLSEKDYELASESLVYHRHRKECFNGNQIVCGKANDETYEYGIFKRTAKKTGNPFWVFVPRTVLEAQAQEKQVAKVEAPKAGKVDLPKLIASLQAKGIDANTILSIVAEQGAK